MQYFKKMGYARIAYRVDYEDYKRYINEVCAENGSISAISKGAVTWEKHNIPILLMGYFDMKEYKELPLFGKETLCAREDLFSDQGITSIAFSGIDTVDQIATILNSLTWHQVHAYYLANHQNLTNVVHFQTNFEEQFFNDIKEFYLKASKSRQVVMSYSGF